MKRRNVVTVFILMILSIVSFESHAVWAMEHGGSTMQDYGDMNMGSSKDDDAATLKEAAAALKDSNPGLAKKLEKLSNKQCGI